MYSIAQCAQLCCTAVCIPYCRPYHCGTEYTLLLSILLTHSLHFMHRSVANKFSSSVLSYTNGPCRRPASATPPCWAAMMMSCHGHYWHYWHPFLHQPGQRQQGVQLDRSSRRRPSPEVDRDRKSTEGVPPSELSTTSSSSSESSSDFCLRCILAK
jgi:hypothetical protein